MSGFAKAALRKLMENNEEQNNKSRKWNKTATDETSIAERTVVRRNIGTYENMEIKSEIQCRSSTKDLREFLDLKRAGRPTLSEANTPRDIATKKDSLFDKRDFLFPGVPKNIRQKIQLDDVAQFSVTDMRTADKISDFIAKLRGLHNDLVITDGTACVGGNTISFSKKFRRVQAIEHDENRYHMLKHNLKILDRTNVECYRADYLKLLSELKQDVVFLDPPWGGPSYKEKDNIELFLGNTPLSEVSELLKTKAKYVIIKAPTNLNYEKFKANISGVVNVFHDFRKMILIVINYWESSSICERTAEMKIHDKDGGNSNSRHNVKESLTNHANDNRVNPKTISSSSKNANVASVEDSIPTTYHDLADDAVKYASSYYSDYVTDNYVCDRVYGAALDAAKFGACAARTAAIAAYFNVTDDIEYARRNYSSDDVKEYLRFADQYDHSYDEEVNDSHVMETSSTNLGSAASASESLYSPSSSAFVTSSTRTDAIDEINLRIDCNDKNDIDAFIDCVNAKNNTGLQDVNYSKVASDSNSNNDANIIRTTADTEIDNSTGSLVSKTSDATTSTIASNRTAAIANDVSSSDIDNGDNIPHEALNCILDDDDF